MQTTKTRQLRPLPLAPGVVEQLRRDAADVLGTAARKGLTLDPKQARIEAEAAKTYFDVGVRLHYYAPRLDIPWNMVDRTDALRCLFLAGITSPGNMFNTVFGFGENEFNKILTAPDLSCVIGLLRSDLERTRDGRIATGFKRHGWAIQPPAPKPDYQRAFRIPRRREC